MAVVNPIKEVQCLRITGKIGRPNLFGAIEFGFSFFGDGWLPSGVYQRRHKGKRVITARLRHYRPTNTQKPNQQAWRGKFADAMHAWGLLTVEQKAVYNKNGVTYRLPGYCMFVKEYLQSLRGT